MKIALVFCPQANPDKPPISLAYLGAYLSQRSIEVQCFDFNIDLYFESDSKKKAFWDPQSTAEWMDELKYNSADLVDESVILKWTEEIERADPQIVGFSLLSTNICSTLRLAEKIKARINNIKIIFGGPEVYRLYGLYSNYMLKYADALILGEGEENLFKITADLASGRIEQRPGVIAKENSPLRGADNFNLIENIDKIPFPDYSLFNLRKYKQTGQLPFVFSRGCINKCSFCFESVYWKKFRCRSIDNIIEEISEIRKKYGIWCLSLNDSLVNGNMKFLSEFCNRIISEDIKVDWWGMARINRQMTEEFIREMVKAGCKQIAYGIESGSQKVLDLMHKNYDVNMMDEVILNTYKAGIKPGVNLMLGFPGEDEEDFLKTCEFVKRNGKYISYVNITTLGIEPFTDIYENRKILGIDFKGSIDWQTTDGTNNYQIRNDRAAKLSEIANEYTGKTVSFI